jgi:hypothetical protein
VLRRPLRRPRGRLAAEQRLHQHHQLLLLLLLLLLLRGREVLLHLLAVSLLPRLRRALAREPDLGQNRMGGRRRGEPACRPCSAHAGPPLPGI